MANPERTDRLSEFSRTGVYRFENSTAIFIDPVRVLNRSYTRFRLSPSAYYSRYFDTASNPNSSTSSSKLKLKDKQKAQTLNQRELIAEQRHQEVRPVLLKAQESLLGAWELLEAMRNLRSDEDECGEWMQWRGSNRGDVPFVKLGSVWQAQFYEIALNYSEDDKGLSEQKVVPVFNNLIANKSISDVEAEFLKHKYILPKQSCFYMSDLWQIDNLIPADSDSGFNLIVIDPPWENSSAHQKLRYETLPNRYFLSIPIKRLTHTVGALVALWVTNREKLRSFVENELFPAWGVKRVATFYWLKVKADGSLIGELDLFHHRPYECLLLGYSHGAYGSSDCLSMLKLIPDNQVFISVPGEYSRKPPVGELLREYAPGFQPARCIELFAREILAGWTSWGNEPLHFQDCQYFLHKRTYNDITISPDDMPLLQEKPLSGCGTH